MSSPQMSAEFTPESVKFLMRPSGFTVLNSTDEVFEFTFDGNSRFIPARGDVVYPNLASGYEDVCFSATYEGEEEYIPGSLIIRDLPRLTNALGGSQLLWSAEVAVKNVFQVDAAGNMTSSSIFKKGLSLLPESPTRTQVAIADRKGRERWKRWQIKKALDIRQDHEAKNDKRKSEGRGVMPVNDEVLWADSLIDATQSNVRKSIAKEFAPEVTVAVPTPPVRAISPDLTDEQVEAYIVANPEILMKAKLRRELDEEVTIRKRPVPKSKQKQRARLKKPGPIKNAKQITIPVD